METIENLRPKSSASARESGSGDTRRDTIPDRWILLADDDDDVRRLVAFALRDCGYGVTEVKNGLELWSRIGACVLEGAPQPDVIIADVRMPYFSGPEVLSCARRVDLKSPFILITAHWDPASCAEVHELGAKAVFYKPFDIDALLTAVANLVPVR